MNRLGWSAKGTILTQKELDEYVRIRPRAGTKEVISFGSKKRNNYEEIEVIHGLCPNNSGRKYCLECEKIDAQGSCHRTCT